MCGRFTLKTPPAQWAQLLLPVPVDASKVKDWQPRYNIAPTQNILAIASDGETHEPILQYYRWGLVPGWSTDLSIGNRMINARVETLHEKRSFKQPLDQRRCLIVADGYYEWQKKPDGTKQPFWLAPENGQLMLMAGLWETNRRASDGPIQSCTIVTTSSSGKVAEIHDRAPVTLSGDTAIQWLQPGCDGNEAHQLALQAQPPPLEIQAVSTLVNNPRNDSEQCIVATEA